MASELAHWKSRCAVLEEIIDALDAALEVVPITPISMGQRWIPSDEAVAKVTKAKDILDWYHTHHNGNVEE